MRTAWHSTGPNSLLLALALMGGVLAPVTVAAQEEAQEQTVDRETMTRFARAHLAINEARDEFHGKVARVHDEEGRVRAREEVETTIRQVLETEKITREEYDDMILRISLNGDLRTMFDEIVAELEAGRGSG
jgi:hypothetical protein